MRYGINDHSGDPMIIHDVIMMMGLMIVDELIDDVRKWTNTD